MQNDNGVACVVVIVMHQCNIMFMSCLLQNIVYAASIYANTLRTKRKQLFSTTQNMYLRPEICWNNILFLLVCKFM